ncbi:MAG TPA: hypothetical protein VF384_00135 [Planctomycetota bacterium]
MMQQAARGPFALTFRRCLLAATLPTAAAALLSLLVATLLRTELADAGEAPGAMTTWIALPLFVAALTCAGSAASFWPAFADRRPGADWVIRLQRGALRGNGAVVGAVLCAQLLLCLPLALLLLPALGAPATANAHFVLPPPPLPVLDQHQRLLRLPGPGLACTELQLRPLASPPEGPLLVPSRLAVRADGVPLTALEVSFEQTGQLVRLPFAATAFRELELELLDGTVPLFFPHGAVVAVGAAAFPGLGNGLLAMLLALVPTFLALAVGCLCGVSAAIPTVLTVVAILLFLQMLGGLGPCGPALLVVMRGQWLGSGSLFPSCYPSLLVASVAMILAMVLRTRSGR